MARELCDQEEPELTAAGAAGHVAACHFHKELAGDIAAEEVFDVANVADLELGAAIEAQPQEGV
jgi:hypothetical protein